MHIDRIGERVRKARKELGLTQQQLADRAGVSRLTLLRLEAGRLRDLRYGLLLRLLNEVNLDLWLGTANLGRPTLDDLLREQQE